MCIEIYSLTAYIQTPGFVQAIEGKQTVQDSIRENAINQTRNFIGLFVESG